MTFISPLSQEPLCLSNLFKVRQLVRGAEKLTWVCLISVLTLRVDFSFQMYLFSLKSLPPPTWSLTNINWTFTITWFPQYQFSPSTNLPSSLSTNISYRIISSHSEGFLMIITWSQNSAAYFQSLHNFLPNSIPVFLHTSPNCPLWSTCLMESGPTEAYGAMLGRAGEYVML